MTQMVETNELTVFSSSLRYSNKERSLLVLSSSGEEVMAEWLWCILKRKQSSPPAPDCASLRKRYTSLVAGPPGSCWPLKPSRSRAEPPPATSSTGDLIPHHHLMRSRSYSAHPSTLVGTWAP